MNIWVLKDSKMLVFKQNSPFEQTQFIEVGVASFKFYLLSQRYMLCDIENGFYCLVYFHYEYLRAQVMKIFFFFFYQNNVLEQTQFWSEVSWILYQHFFMLWINAAISMFSYNGFKTVLRWYIFSCPSFKSNGIKSESIYNKAELLTLHS